MEAAAAALMGAKFEERSGSAVYLLASLFNHSCAPNMACGFPHNDGAHLPICLCKCGFSHVCAYLWGCVCVWEGGKSEREGGK